MSDRVTEYTISQPVIVVVKVVTACALRANGLEFDCVFMHADPELQTTEIRMESFLCFSFSLFYTLARSNCSNMCYYSFITILISS